MSLEQAEQLWISAATVGPEVKPLLLFYALAQASRAIVANHDTIGRPATVGGHGMTTRVDEGKFEKDPLDAIQTKVLSPGKRGQNLIHRVADLVGSPIEEGFTMSLKEALQATPFAFHAPISGIDLGRGPLAVKCFRPPDYLQLEAAFPKGVLLREPQRATSQKFGMTQLDPIVRYLEDHYPRFANLGLPSTAYCDTTESSSTIQFVYKTSPQPGPLYEAFDAIHDRNPDGRVINIGGIFMPRMPNNASSLHPLVAWWLVLFPLSILARYHPNLWQKLLDIDRSSLAEPLSNLLSRQTLILPTIIHGTLRQPTPPLYLSRSATGMFGDGWI